MGHLILAHCQIFYFWHDITILTMYHSFQQMPCCYLETCFIASYSLLNIRKLTPLTLFLALDITHRIFFSCFLYRFYFIFFTISSFCLEIRLKKSRPCKASFMRLQLGLLRRGGNSVCFDPIRERLSDAPVCKWF